MRRKNRTLWIACSLLFCTTFGSSVARANPAVIGEWGPLFTLGDPVDPPGAVENLDGVVAVHTIVLKSGKVLIIGLIELYADMPNPYVYFDPSDDSVSQIYFTPSVDEGQNIGLAEHSLFCSGHVQLEDGRVLFVGGGQTHGNKVTIFDPDGGPTEDDKWSCLASHFNWNLSTAFCERLFDPLRCGSIS